MKKFLLISLLVSILPAQVPRSTWLPMGGVNVTTETNFVTQSGLTGALSSQSICDTSDACPPGLYTLFAYVSIQNTGTLLSAVTANITFTDWFRTNSNLALGGALSLLSTAPASYVYTFYHAANTAVTVATTTTTLTGSPSYNISYRLVWSK